MNLQPSTESFLSDVEKFAQRKFRYRLEIGSLVELAGSLSLQRVLDDVTFYAKFLTNAFNVLQRIGKDSPDAAKLSVEFQEGIEKISTMLRTLIKGGPAEVRNLFLQRFLSLSGKSLNELLALCRELCWLKNYALERSRQNN